MRLHYDISLPTSKSESNRALMIAAYGGFDADFENISDSKDTMVLRKALNSIPFMSLAMPNAKHFQCSIVCRQESIKSIPQVIDIADCGTAARFLTTFLACHEGHYILTGTERMKQRPIKSLVDALLKLGTDMQYVEKQDFLPLQIQGKPIQGGKTCIDMTQSSQFASSLLLAAPMFPHGLELELLGKCNSLPYLDMTLSMMRHFGAEAERMERKIIVKPKPYQPKSFAVSSDWSAASYWYEMAAFSEECEIRLRSMNLSKGCQGDSILAGWMSSLGVNTVADGDSLVLTNRRFEKKLLSFDFSDTPDLFPMMVATCAGLQLESRFTSIANLRIKESDRVEAMKKELAKMGVGLEIVSENEAYLVPSETLPFYEKDNPLKLCAHKDHRIVMALAPLSMKVGYLTFDHPEVVEKSYLGFWKNVPFLPIV